MLLWEVTMIDFSKRIKNGIKIKKIDPIEIYNTLDRSSVTGPLRPVQFNVLTKWNKEYRDKKDLIIKLHTGAGKTLVGLLIAMSYINNNEGPVVYVCPNIYLMQQVCQDAQKFGIPFCIINKDNEIPNDFLNGKRVLITYVQKVFNGLSIFGTGNQSMHVGCIILDDSHACIDSMNGSCTIQILSDNPAYQKILDLVEQDLRDQGVGTFHDILNKRSNGLIPIPYWCWQDKINEITKIISEQTDDNHIKFAWPLLKDQLVDCRAFFSSNKIEIAPACLPIQQYGIFNNAAHRILMSATTQEDTFFIKGLRLSVDAVRNPLVDEKYTWSGEKMILIPDSICENVDTDDLLNYVLTTTHDFGIAVLTPSFEKSKKYEKMGGILANSNSSGKTMFQILRDYLIDHKNKTIIFANRYDGIDLPDDTCRILIIDSVPYYDSLSDRYEELCRSESEIIRIKTIQKIEQGLGRSVRGEKDYSVILITGSDLIKYIRSVSNQKFFSPQTQRQIQIGFDIVDMAKEDLPEGDSRAEINLFFNTISQCLTRDEGWKAYYSSEMEGIELSQTDRTQLYHVLQQERKAYDEANTRNYEAASETMQSIADSCADPYEKGWYLQEKARFLYRISHTDSNKVQVSAFKMNTQLMKPRTGIVYNKLKYPWDNSRTSRIINELRTFGNYDELSVQLEDTLSNMSFGVDAEKAENAFYRIGQLLGYMCQRPDKEIRQGPDVLWCTACDKYILIECKTEVQLDRKHISKSEAGQMEEHCAWFKATYGEGISFEPVLVIPTEKLAADAYFSHDTDVLKKDGLDKLKNQIREFFKEFKKYDFAGLDGELVNEKLIAHNLHNDSFINTVVTRAKK